MSNEERLRSLLSDLGKATLRGVKKCPKCGTYNGSRGLCCKNKYCDAVFKEPGERRKLSTEACKLIGGSMVQVFSVRVRDKGPDYRGFVQLLNNGGNEPSLVPQSTALCFVDSCERSFDNSVLKCHEKDPEKSPTSCQHIQAALRCYAEAQPLTLRNSILSSMNVNNETKQEIWLLATETSGPLVQRVSKNIMAVKCKASPKHPLGYLHFSFYTTKTRERVEHRYFCTCSAFKAGPKGEKGELPRKRCSHFYACICAFASDIKLSEEFMYYINLDKKETKAEKTVTAPFQEVETDRIVGLDLEALTDDTHLFIFRDDTLTVQSLEPNRLDIDSINLDTTILSNIDVDCESTFLDNSGIIGNIATAEIIDQNALINPNTVRILDDTSPSDGKLNFDLFLENQGLRVGSVKILEPGTTFVDGKSVKLLNNTALIIENSEILMPDVKISPDVSSKASRSCSKRKRDEKLQNVQEYQSRRGKTKTAIIKKGFSCENLDEDNAILSFTTWLASITERINQTMHFQFDGKPEPLIFHVPQVFFDCLRERISWGGKKKRLPNSTTAFVRKDGVPLGTFTKYTWQITNILHVKSIFDTSLMPLEITRTFVQNSDGSYEVCTKQDSEGERYKKTGSRGPINPLEIKTYLKVGNTSPNQVEPTPFLIEWIPDILPISKIGEMRLKFEFGHVKSEVLPQKSRKVALSKNY